LLKLGKLAVLSTLVLAVLAPSQLWAITAAEILTKCAAKYDAVRDYTCMVTVTTDFPNMRMPTRTFTVYFKKPDKVKVESQGQLVMVPRDVLLLGNLHRYLRDQAKTTLAGETAERGRKVFFIKVLPKNDDPNRMLLWVWGDTWTIKKTEVWTGSTKVLAAEWTHLRVGRFYMPKRVLCTVTGGKMAEQGSGTITLDFAKWQVNSGLSDDIFVQQPSK
jgi:outer membrane lipoprotein-sorting protein